MSEVSERDGDNEANGEDGEGNSRNTQRVGRDNGEFSKGGGKYKMDGDNSKDYIYFVWSFNWGYRNDDIERGE